MQLKVGDTFRCPAYSGGFRVWKVLAVSLGGENQEHVCQLQTLDRIEATDVPLIVPIEILDRANLERV